MRGGACALLCPSTLKDEDSSIVRWENEHALSVVEREVNRDMDVAQCTGLLGQERPVKMTKQLVTG